MKRVLIRLWLAAALPLILLACLCPAECDEDVNPLDAWRKAWDEA